jgi:hypothetical protein
MSEPKSSPPVSVAVAVPVSVAVAVTDQKAVSSILSAALHAGPADSAHIAVKGSPQAVVSVLLGLGAKAGSVSALLSLRKS